MMWTANKAKNSAAGVMTSPTATCGLTLRSCWRAAERTRLGVGLDDVVPSAKDRNDDQSLRRQGPELVARKNSILMVVRLPTPCHEPQVGKRMRTWTHPRPHLNCSGQ
jgi:hypothetical protein